ncbi:MAG: class I SAM-dependent methyltransferase [Rhodospirillales bacterium]|nr:class I SAM-dependent methyltransferase [Rhodospirillales bacterium]
MSKPRKRVATTADFGFREVPAAEKAGRVRAVFDSVAPSYDLMNDLMSAGVHRLWKAAFVDDVFPRPGETILDVAGGTGDIAFRLRDAAAGPAGDPARGAQIAVCDINPAMLGVGRDRALDRGILDGIAWMAGDAERLPVASASIDAYTIAFGLRNVTDIDAALAEARRVLKPGGRFFCLEFSHVAVPVVRRLYDHYSFAVLPALGELVAGDRAAYQYLAESIRRFPPQAGLVRRMAAAGLDRARYRNLSGGIAAIHAAWRL